MKLSSTLGLLLCLSFLWGTESKRNGDRGKQVAGRPNSESDPKSGELLTRGKHKCTWEMSETDVIVLQVRCTHEDGAYQCQYTGMPDLCPDSKVTPRHYWTKALRKLRKKIHACEGSKVLKVAACKLAVRSRSERQTEKQDKEQEERRRKGSRPRGKEKKNPKGEKPPKEMKDLSREMSDMEPEETYCAEGWSTVCTFFVRFFVG